VGPHRFPILLSNGEDRARPDCPRSVPWAFVEPFRARAQDNHDQTLERLAQRGGLCPRELWAAAHDARLFSPEVKALTLDDAISWLLQTLATSAAAVS